MEYIIRCHLQNIRSETEETRLEAHQALDELITQDLGRTLELVSEEFQREGLQDVETHR